MIIGLTNARMDVADLVHYLMNSDEDFDETEFAFDWSERPGGSGKHQLRPIRGRRRPDPSFVGNLRS